MNIALDLTLRGRHRNMGQNSGLPSLPAGYSYLTYNGDYVVYNGNYVIVKV